MLSWYNYLHVKSTNFHSPCPWHFVTRILKRKERKSCLHKHRRKSGLTHMCNVLCNEPTVVSWWRSFLQQIMSDPLACVRQSAVFPKFHSSHLTQGLELPSRAWSRRYTTPQIICIFFFYNYYYYQKRKYASAIPVCHRLGCMYIFLQLLLLLKEKKGICNSFMPQTWL
jgi:hypothetical protein